MDNFAYYGELESEITLKPNVFVSLYAYSEDFGELNPLFKVDKRYNFIKFNQDNIWDTSLIYNNKNKEPIEVYDDDKGNVFIIDGHHRAMNNILNNVPYNKWNVKQTNEENITGIDFINWETPSDFVEKKSLLKKGKTSEQPGGHPNPQSFAS